jgi:hypothetical protein
MAPAVASVSDLLDNPPLIHGWMSADGLITHGLIPEALRYLERTVGEGQRTLETGSGLSTITFALRGARHTCITPDGSEEERIRAFCVEQGISDAGLDFQIGPSERVLPALELDPLDLVLIDGSHSFPQVFIDFFYVQAPLKVGGTLVVDDVHIWTGRVLRDFLRAEPEWELAERWGGRTVAFRKTAEVEPGRDWSDQAYVDRRTRAATVGRAKMAGALLRDGDFAQFGRRVRDLLPGGRGR